jgi:hypothetical protein
MVAKNFWSLIFLKKIKMEVANNVNPSNGGFAGEKKDDYLKKVVGIGVSVAILFATVWVVGRAWKKSQK